MRFFGDGSPRNEVGMFYQESVHLGIILRCQVRNHSVPVSASVVQRCWSCCCQAQHQCRTCLYCYCLNRGVIHECQDSSHGLCPFSLWIYLWGITVIKRNVWSCEELSCWKNSLVLSHTCPYIDSQLYKRQSSTSENTTVWLCWSSFSCIFFSFISIIPGITWELVSEDVCFFPGVHHPKATALWESPFIWAFLPVSVLHLSRAFMLSWCWLGLTSLLSVKKALDVHLRSITNAI